MSFKRGGKPQKGGLHGEVLLSVVTTIASSSIKRLAMPFFFLQFQIQRLVIANNERVSRQETFLKINVFQKGQRTGGKERREGRKKADKNACAEKVTICIHALK